MIRDDISDDTEVYVGIPMHEDVPKTSHVREAVREARAYPVSLFKQVKELTVRGRLSKPLVRDDV